MGKIYCTECGTELEDTVKFCSKCGTKIDNNVPTNNFSEGTAVDEKSPKKANINKKSNTTKIFLGIVGVCIILIILGIVLTGFSVNNSSDTTNINDENSNQSYIENIYGIDFSIPSYFTEADSVDYEEDEYGGISCSRTYDRPDGTGIAILVATSPTGWNLNNAVGSIDMTVNGHHGKLSSSRDVFGYISGDKLVVISGTSQEEVEKIII